MNIHWQARIGGDLLIVEASGVDDDLADVQAHGMAVIAEARRTGVRRVLCDERQLRYRLGLGDTWAAAAALAGQDGLRSRASWRRPPFGPVPAPTP